LIKLKKEGEKELDSDSDSDSDDEENCGICLDSINNYDVGVTVCGHIFHYECLKQQFNINKKCPMCNKQLEENDIYLVSYEKKQKNPNEEIKDKISLINKVGTKLGNLIFYLLSIDEHVIIFSQWDNLLKEVGLVLNEYGIKNVFCRGNVWQRDMAIRRFYSDDDIKVILLSSESAASGTNLTKASKVILLDPVYGSYEHRKNTEWQAVGRAYRLGQTKEVEVVRFIIKNSVEDEIYIENKNNDSKINENRVINETTEDSINLSSEKIIKLKKNIKI
jgi:SNF2 family DNA or RNA helicase